MPLTFAHPAAILPLRGTMLPTSALVIGSMVPDAPLFLPVPASAYGATHSAVGVVTLDVLVGLLAWALWWFVLVEPLADASPAGLRRRLTYPLRSRTTWWVVPALSVGALTHVVWDAFTHEGRWGVTLVPWLAQDHLDLPGYKWAQYGSGIAGLLVLAGVGLLAWRRRPLGDVGPRRHPRIAAATGLAPVVAAAAVAAWALLSAGSLHDAIFRAVTEGAAAALLCLLGSAGLWHLTRAT